MNDSTEFERGRATFVDAVEARIGEESDATAKELLTLLRRAGEQAAPDNVFCICMSDVPDDIGQWRGYGNDGKGCRLTFDLEELSDWEGIISGRVRYHEDEQVELVNAVLGDLEAILKPGFEAGQLIESTELLNLLAQKLSALFAFFKDPSFQAESEYRFAYVRDPNGGTTELDLHYRAKTDQVVPYIKLSFFKNHRGPLPIKAIALGPGVRKELTIDAIRNMLQDRGYTTGAVVVESSRIPYLPG